MPENLEHPDESKLRQEKEEYENPHFDESDSDIVPADDVEPQGPHLPAQRKSKRKLPTRRHYEE